MYYFSIVTDGKGVYSVRYSTEQNCVIQHKTGLQYPTFEAAQKAIDHLIQIDWAPA